MKEFVVILECGISSTVSAMSVSIEDGRLEFYVYDPITSKDSALVAAFTEWLYFKQL